MKDVLSRLRPFPEDPAKPYRDPYPPPRKKRRWKVPALLLAGAVLGAAPFLFHIWGGQHSTKLSFEHAYSIATDTSSREDFVYSAWARLSVLGEDGFAALHELRRVRRGFDPAVQTTLNRLEALLDGQQLARRRRPNRLSFADSLRGIGDRNSSRMHVQACLDILVFDLEETIRGLHTWKKKGGEPGEAAASTLSWFRWFLKGH